MTEEFSKIKIVSFLYFDRLKDTFLFFFIFYALVPSLSNTVIRLAPLKDIRYACMVTTDLLNCSRSHDIKKELLEKTRKEKYSS